MFSKLMLTIKRWKKEKKEYKIYLERIKKLPEDYRKTFKKIDTYMWSFASSSSMLDVLYDILDMFEEGVAVNKKITDIVGTDVGSFCEDILKEIPEKTWINDIKKRINKCTNKK